MNPRLKISRRLLLQALADLTRPHPLAHERLGFFAFRQSLHRRTPLILCYDYHPIPDEQYIPDNTCGARIGGTAIRAAMGRAFRGECGQLWVHTHGRRGQPFPSETDLRGGPNVVRSLANAQPSRIQGWAIISEESAWGQIRYPDGRFQNFDDATVIGWPLTISKNRRELRERNHLFWFFNKQGIDKRYDRQDFLGATAQCIFTRAKVGIVGLGGGGSHINQQLAHIGFRRVVLCDDDRVESSNLNRLVGATLRSARWRSWKTQVAKRLFKKLVPNAELNHSPKNWEFKKDQLRDCDLIFGCLDSFRGRRDLEAFCRAHMIPLIDIGMMVRRSGNDAPEINGQVILSMPGEPCMHCLQVLTAENLAREAEDYNAGSQPQVIWPNGVLASSAVGQAVGLLTGWSGASHPACRVDYHASKLTISESNIARVLQNRPCPHYPLSASGDPIFHKL